MPLPPTKVSLLSSLVADEAQQVSDFLQIYYTTTPGDPQKAAAASKAGEKVDFLKPV
jgi:hypothetical protein